MKVSDSFCLFSRILKIVNIFTIYNVIYKVNLRFIVEIWERTSDCSNPIAIVFIRYTLNVLHYIDKTYKILNKKL